MPTMDQPHRQPSDTGEGVTTGDSSPAHDGESSSRWPGYSGAWPIERRGVVIVGENPMIVLYQPGSDDPVAIASVWTCAYSPAGTGHVLVIWTDVDATGLGNLAPVGILADNPDLARFVWDNFYNDYDVIHNKGVEDAPLRAAVFQAENEGQQGQRIRCSDGDTTIELDWRDPLDVFHVVTYPTGYEASVVAVPCSRGTITVNGQRARGDVRHPEGWFGSSAFLAFAETWIALEEPAGEAQPT